MKIKGEFFAEHPPSHILFNFTLVSALYPPATVVSFHSNPFAASNEKKKKKEEKVDKYKDREREQEREREKERKLAVGKIYQLKIRVKIVFHLQGMSLS